MFDEDRYFEPATGNTPVEILGTKVGITICEDIWNDEVFLHDRRYDRRPAEELAAAGAELLLNLSASPWSLGKEHSRHVLLSQLSAKCGCPVVYCNLVGGNDELVFDGGSQYYNGHGVLGASGAMFAEDLLLIDTETIEPKSSDTSDDNEKIYRALSLGVRDYLHKCGFASAVIGLSGGIDSAVTAAVAVDALGPENVRGVAMPSQYSSQGSLDDAEAWPGAGHPVRRRADRTGVRATQVATRRHLRGTRRGHDRGEHAGAPTGQHPHVDVQQVRLAAADDRQQERVGGRLLHALRRHVRRPGRDQ